MKQWANYMLENFNWIVKREFQGQIWQITQQVLGDGNQGGTLTFNTGQEHRSCSQVANNSKPQHYNLPHPLKKLASDGCQRVEGLGNWVKKMKGFRSTHWYSQKSEGCKVQYRQYS